MKRKEGYGDLHGPIDASVLGRKSQLFIGPMLRDRARRRERVSCSPIFQGLVFYVLPCALFSFLLLLFFCFVSSPPPLLFPVGPFWSGVMVPRLRVSEVLDGLLKPRATQSRKRDGYTGSGGN